MPAVVTTFTDFIYTKQQMNIISQQPNNISELEKSLKVASLMPRNMNSLVPRLIPHAFIAPAFHTASDKSLHGYKHMHAEMTEEELAKW